MNFTLTPVPSRRALPKHYRLPTPPDQRRTRCKRFGNPSMQSRRCANCRDFDLCFAAKLASNKQARISSPQNSPATSKHEYL